MHKTGYITFSSCFCNNGSGINIIFSAVAKMVQFYKFCIDSIKLHIYKYILFKRCHGDQGFSEAESSLDHSQPVGFWLLMYILLEYSFWRYVKCR